MSTHCASGLMPNPLRIIPIPLAIALAITLLASCGPTPQAGGGIGGTGVTSSVSSGAVTKLSGVHISETEYDNSNAFYCIDGEPCTTENNLKVGMVVLVKGASQTLSQGTVIRIADTITFEETVEGVVQTVARDASSLIILGQFVEVNEHTIIDEGIPEKSILNLKPGQDVVVVSGFVAADGHILATLIMNRSGTPHYEVQGIIKNHDVEANCFEIGQLLVDYSTADVRDITADNTMSWNGRVVHVRGDEWQLRSGVPHGATLRAAQVKPLGFTVKDSAEAKLQGFITRVTESGAFLVNNHPIHVSSITTFKGGTMNELVLGTHVFIHGVLVQGVLEADEVVYK